MSATTTAAPHPLAGLLGRRARPAVLGTVTAAIVVPQVLSSRSLLGIPLTGDQLLGIGLTQVNFALITIIATLALNFLIGHGYLISIGDAALMGIGTVAAATLGTQAGLPFPLVLAGAVIAGAGCGLLVGLPALRVRGLYLLLSTLALHYIVVWLMVRYQLRFFGVAGIDMPEAVLLGWAVDTPLRWYAVLLVLAVGVGLLLHAASCSREGRALRATKGHEHAAASLGIHVGRVRLKAFTLYGAVLGLAGALYGYQLGLPGSESYHLGMAIGHIAIIIIGGLGSMGGTVVAALVWSLLPTVISTVGRLSQDTVPLLGPFINRHRFLLSDLLLGITVIMFLRYRPGGIASAIGRRRAGGGR